MTIQHQDATPPRTLKYPALTNLAAELGRDGLFMIGGAAAFSTHWWVSIPCIVGAHLASRLRDYARDQIEPT